MNLNHLKYFVDSADLKSCSKAAVKNRITQPALSQSIRNLESELGYEIIKHRPKSFELTSNGLEFLKYAREILALIEKAKTATSKGPEQLPVRIVCTHSFFKHFLRPILPALKKKCPQWDISISFGDREKIKRDLADKKADLGFLLATSGLSSFKVQKIKSGHFYEISSGLENGPLYVTSLEDKEIKRTKKDLRSLSEVGSWESIYELVHSHLGDGVVPDYLIADGELKKKKLGGYDLVMIERKVKGPRTLDFSSVLLRELKKIG